MNAAGTASVKTVRIKIDLENKKKIYIYTELPDI